MKSQQQIDFCFYREKLPGNPLMFAHALITVAIKRPKVKHPS